MMDSASSSASSRSLSSRTRRTLDGIFFLIVALLLVSTSVDANGGNVFRLTLLPLDVPNTTLFETLATKRKNGLTRQDLLLQVKLLSLDLRRLYLRYGPRTMASCIPCNAEDVALFTAHHFFFYILIPHSLNMSLTSFVISRSVNTKSSPYFRIKALLLAFSLFVADIYVTIFLKLPNDPEGITPASLYSTSLIFRPVVFALYNYALSVFIFHHATGRFAICPYSFANR